MEKILTEQERAEAFNRILNKENKYSRDEISLYIKGLSELERAGVLKYAEDKKTGAMDFVNRFRELNPSNKEYPYTNNYQFNDAITVIARIEVLSTQERKPEPEQEPIKKKTGSYEEIISVIIKKENKFWKKLPMEAVVNHFEIMTTNKNKKGEYYLSQKQFISFLKRGFLNIDTEPKQKINCSAGEKGKVIKKFYEFYALANSKYYHPAKTQRFINLFIDCFDNWEPDSIKHSFKPYKTRENI